MKRLFCAVLLVASLAACGSVTSMKLSNENRSDVAAAVAKSNLADGDKALFAAASARADTGDYDVTGKTVGDVLSDERTYENDQKAKEAAARALADDVRRRQEARTRALESALTLALVDKGFHAADYTNGEYQSTILVQLALKNTGSRTIRSVKGVVHFENSLGDDIDAVPFTYEQPLAPQRSAVYDGSIDFNQYEDATVRLRDASMSNLRVRWEPQVILFADGSRLAALGNDQ